MNMTGEAPRQKATVYKVFEHDEKKLGTIAIMPLTGRNEINLSLIYNGGNYTIVIA